jgi:hypothetical protein
MHSVFKRRPLAAMRKQCKGHAKPRERRKEKGTVQDKGSEVPSVQERSLRSQPDCKRGSPENHWPPIVGAVVYVQIEIKSIKLKHRKNGREPPSVPIEAHLC